MNPRAIAVWVAAAVTVALATDNPVYRVLVALVAANLLVRHRLPGRSLRPLLAASGVASATAIILNILLAHTGAHAMATVPAWVPGLGGPLTVESMVFGCVAALGITAAFLAVAALSYLIEPEQAVEALPRALERTGTAVAAALSLVPALGRTYRSVYEAQLVRGWRPAGPRSWSELLVPVVLTAFEDSVQVAEAMEARAFGSGPRTRLDPGPWRLPDAIVAVAAAAAAAIVVAGRVSGAVADWYPYPSLSAPPVAPLFVVACLLLAVPLVPWPSRASTA